MTAPSSTFFIKQNDTSPSIVEYLRNADGTAINLTGSSVKFHLRDSAGTIKVNAAAIKVDEANGKVQYDWIAADTNTVGQYSREWEVTLPSGRIVTVPNDRSYLVIITDDLA